MCVCVCVCVCPNKNELNLVHVDGLLNSSRIVGECQKWAGFLHVATLYASLVGISLVLHADIVTDLLGSLIDLSVVLCL